MNLLVLMMLNILFLFYQEIVKKFSLELYSKKGIPLSYNYSRDKSSKFILSL